MTPGLGLYIHWPYCARICPYCDFNVVRDRGRDPEKAGLVDAIVDDLESHAALTGERRLTSIFFGGGTPSRMVPSAVGRIIHLAGRLWPVEPHLEVTLEANPADIEPGRLADLAVAGVNRLSLGLQSLDDGELRLLGRDHDAAAGRRAVEVARSIFPHLSLDLIYALPGQTLEHWTEALEEAVELGAEHISAYQLTIEPGTSFARAVRRGTVVPPPEDRAADLFEATQTVLEGFGFEAYEISNHARGAAARSRHNLNYWRGGDYVGVGPGAHGRLTLAGRRYATVAPRSVAGYVDAVRRDGSSLSPEPLAEREVALERLLMGLRTFEGVATSDLAPLHIPPRRMGELEGFVEVSDDRLIVTRRGRPVLDRLIAELADAA
ncbi:MAG TPA: radical SAM family heme chaperone HemW [Caulobacteraceae bacterium]